MDTVLVHRQAINAGFQAQHFQQGVHLFGQTAADVVLKFVENHLFKGILIGYDAILGEESTTYADHGMVQKKLTAEDHFVQSLLFKPCGGCLLVQFDGYHVLLLYLLPVMGGSAPACGRLQGLFPCPGSTAALLPVGAPNASLSPGRDIFILVC